MSLLHWLFSDYISEANLFIWMRLFIPLVIYCLVNINRFGNEARSFLRRLDDAFDNLGVLPDLNEIESPEDVDLNNNSLL